MVNCVEHAMFSTSNRNFKDHFSFGYILMTCYNREWKLWYRNSKTRRTIEKALQKLSKILHQRKFTTETKKKCWIAILCIYSVEEWRLANLITDIEETRDDFRYFYRLMVWEIHAQDLWPMCKVEKTRTRQNHW